MKILVVIDRLTVAQADQAEAQQGQGTAAEHRATHLVGQAILGHGGVVVDILVEGAPVGLLLQAVVVGPAIGVGLPCGLAHGACAEGLVLHGAGRSLMLTVPVERAIDTDDAAVELGTEGEAPVVVDMVNPVLLGLDEVAAEQHGVARKAAKEQGLQAILRRDRMAVLGRPAAQVGGEADVVVADMSDEGLYLVRHPYVVLVADGHEVALGPHGCRLEVEVEAEVVLISPYLYIRKAGRILITDGDRVVGRLG